VAEAEAVGIFCKAVSTPFEVNGAAWQNGAAMLRVEGLDAQVSYRLGALQNLFQDQNPSVLEGDAHRNLWTGIRDIHAFAQTEDTIWKVSLRPTAAPAFIAAARAHLNARAVLDQGGGLIWLAVPSSEPDQARVVRDLVPAGNGHATLVSGTTDLRCSVPVFHPQHPRLAQISEGLRAQFDPKGILNPFLMAS
jgi:glycolate oxidase FAD binding subunit